MTAKRKAEDWVVMSGKLGEIAHCTRCGEGLSLNLPQRVEVLLAALTAFGRLHRACKPGEFEEPRPCSPHEWYESRDTGTSSMTIFHVMTGRPTKGDEYSVPLDPDDFGRCYRLLNLFSDWKPRLPEVAVRFPEWRPMVERWDEMTSLYEKELPSGTAPLLYELMQDLQKAAGV